jgi:hypothetical protein
LPPDWWSNSEAVQGEDGGGYSVVARAAKRATGGGGAAAETGRAGAMDGEAASRVKGARSGGVFSMQAVAAASERKAPSSVQAPRVEAPRHSSV